MISEKCSVSGAAISVHCPASDKVVLIFNSCVFCALTEVLTNAAM